MQRRCQRKNAELCSRIEPPSLRATKSLVRHLGSNREKERKEKFSPESENKKAFTRDDVFVVRQIKPFFPQALFSLSESTAAVNKTTAAPDSLLFPRSAGPGTLVEIRGRFGGKTFHLQPGAHVVVHHRRGLRGCR